MSHPYPLFPDLYNHNIVRLYYNAECRLLYLLKGRLDGSLYIEIIDILSKQNQYTPDLTGILRIPLSSEYKRPNDTQTHSNNVQIFSAILYFEINFKHNYILLQATFYEREKYNQAISGDNPNRYLIFDFDGRLIHSDSLEFEKKTTYEHDIDSIHSIQFLDDNTLINIPDKQNGEIEYWRLMTAAEKTLIEITCEEEYRSNGEFHSCYEYIDSYLVSRQRNFFGAILAHPEAGKETIKLFRLNGFGKLEMTFNYIADHRDDGAQHYIALSPSGDEFVTLGYNGFDKPVQIRIFKIADNHEPYKIYLIDRSSLSGILGITYISSDMLCFEMFTGFIICDLNTGKIKTTVKKALRTPYCIAENVLFYVYSDNLWMLSLEVAGSYPTLITYKRS